ncbi:putative G-protein coupled receptor 149 [Thomomys bottae]
MSSLLDNSTNDSNLWPEKLNATGQPGAQGSLNVYLFCLTSALALAALAGGVFSLASLLPMPRRGTVPALVAAWAVDDLVGALAATLFLRLQWTRGAAGHPWPLCAAAALLYTGQGLSGNLKAAILVGYNFVSLRRAAGTPAGCRGRGRALGAALGVGAASLALAALPLGGWGAFERTAWGCLVSGPAGLLLCAVYATALAPLAGLAGPLALQLLCSEAPPRALAQYRTIAGGASAPGSPPAGHRADSALGSPEAPSPGDERAVTAGPGPPDAPQAGARAHRNPWESRSFARSVAQRRFALILALIKAVLWLPMMVHMLVQHVAGARSPPLEMLSFLLTLLASAVTPVFVLSRSWAHFPCGCIIDCRQNSYAVASDGRTAKRRGFEFNLSFQQSYGIYRLAREEDYEGVHCSLGCSERDSRQDGGHRAPGTSTQDGHHAPGAVRVEISTRLPEDSASLAGVHARTYAAEGEGTGAGLDLAHGDAAAQDGLRGRLPLQESPTPGLSDWEWCRSRSERTPRQRAGDGLALPLRAFQGMVSLQTPTGKTLSLSTYEVSAEGRTLAPTAQKVEVFRSKSVGHEPRAAEESPGAFADASVKIHVEVLEVCEDEGAPDTVSIVSSISQSSARARSPSLRFSRRENRFVSCELGETASCSLLLPPGGPDGAALRISIPDTVEAHRSGGLRQRPAPPPPPGCAPRGGYHEDIQLLNQAYRQREAESRGGRASGAAGEAGEAGEDTRAQLRRPHPPEP